MNKTTHTINLPTSTKKAELQKLFKELAALRRNYTNAKAGQVERAMDKIKTKIHVASDGLYFPNHKPDGKITNLVQEQLFTEVLLAVK